MTGKQDGVRPRVLFFSAIGGLGGPVQSLIELVDSLDLDWTGVVGPFTEDVESRLKSSTDLVILTPSWSGIGRARAIVELRRALQTHKPDIVFANGLTEAAAVTLALAGLRHPPHLAVWVHNTSVPSMTRVVGPLVRRRRGAWAAVSDWAADLAESSLGDLGCTVIPNPISSSVVGIRSSYPDDRIRIGYFGSDRAHKGFDLLPTVIEQMAEDPVVWRLYTWPVVDQPAWPRIRALEQGGKIEHVRSLSDVGEGYGAVDIVFVPSLVESFCRVVVEANLNGLPVVASDLPPIRQLTQPNQTAILFPVGDSSAAVEALRELARDPQQARAMGARGREAASAFDPRAVGAAWQTRLSALLAS